MKTRPLKAALTVIALMHTVIALKSVINLEVCTF